MDKDTVGNDSVIDCIERRIDEGCDWLSFKWHEDASGKMLCIAVAFIAFAGAPFVLANAAIAVCENLMAAFGVLAWIALCCGVPALGLWLCVKHSMRNADGASDSKKQDSSSSGALEA